MHYITASMVAFVRVRTLSPLNMSHPYIGIRIAKSLIESTVTCHDVAGLRLVSYLHIGATIVHLVILLILAHDHPL
jgi:hypothetical protein